MSSSGRKNVAVLGGAFDPVHKDHVTVAKTCLDRGFCDEVWFMPSPDRWDKTLNASPEDRFAMLELAFSGDKRLVLSDLEIRQGDYRGSYIFLMGLKEEFPDINFRLLTGADTYDGIPRWRHAKATASPTWKSMWPTAMRPCCGLGPRKVSTGSIRAPKSGVRS